MHPCSPHPFFDLLSSLHFLPMIHCTIHFPFHNQLLSAMFYATSDFANGNPSPPPPLINIERRRHVSRQFQDASTNCIQRNHTLCKLIKLDLSSHFSSYVKGKGKAVPLQVWTGPEGSTKLRFPDVVTTAQDAGNVVSLTHRPPLPPRKYSWY